MPYGHHGWLPPLTAPPDVGLIVRMWRGRRSKEEERTRRVKFARVKREEEVKELEEEARKERLSHPSLTRKADTSRPVISRKIPSPETGMHPLRLPWILTGSNPFTSPPPLQSPKASADTASKPTTLINSPVSYFPTFYSKESEPQQSGLDEWEIIRRPATSPQLPSPVKTKLFSHISPNVTTTPPTKSLDISVFIPSLDVDKPLQNAPALTPPQKEEDENADEQDDNYSMYTIEEVTEPTMSGDRPCSLSMKTGFSRNSVNSIETQSTRIENSKTTKFPPGYRITPIFESSSPYSHHTLTHSLPNTSDACATLNRYQTIASQEFFQMLKIRKFHTDFRH
ncbi:hypothetical protein BT69DRAFT_1318281 [Atractiella rhizophila]|nr:hypothetical protein BT69DRAFT_1318281 [Atractiella rhizophila]